MNLSAEGRLRLAAKLAFIVGVGVTAENVYAQEQSTAPAASAENSGSVQLSGVSITGTRIKQANLTSSSSITTISDEELKLQGTNNVETLLNEMPQVFAEYSTNDSNGASGTATVNLRNLGSNRTLVLIDGKRLMPGDPKLPSADVNFIPAALVDHIDILSGGASAVYGSDAIGGVVNFAMKQDFQGFQIDSQLSRTDHSDGTAHQTFLTWGNNFSGGNGNITLYAGYQKSDAITEAARGFSDCALKTNASGVGQTCHGSRVIPGGRLLSYDRYYAGLSYYGIIDPKGTRSIVPDDGRTFNFAPYNYLQRPDSRYSLGGFAHDQINEHLDIFGSAMFMDNHTVAQIAPSGIFGQVASIPCNSPLLSAQEVDYLCTQAGLTAADSSTTAVLLRSTAVGPRQDDLRHTDFRIVIGAKGDIADGWSYEASAQRGEVIYAEQYLNDVSIRKSQNALDVTTDSSGNVVCAGTDPNCVPLDIFQTGQITTAAANYIRGDGFSNATVVEQVVTGTITGDLGRYGVKSPLAKDGAGIVGGWEYRTESSDFRADDEFSTGDLAGQGGATPSLAGAYQVNEAFTEAQMPIIQNARFAKLLQIDGAYRWSNYSLANDAHSWKTGLEFAPTNDVLVRGSFQRALRAPNIQELFSPSSFGLFGGSDPCAGTNLGQAGSPTPQQCANTGVTATQYDNKTIQDCNSGQCNELGGGNTALKPEESITRSVGFVVTPSVVKNLSMSIDYFDIRVSGAIASAPGVELNQCLLTGDPTYCSYIHRGPTGRLSGSTSGGANYVDAPLLNTSVFRTQGFDFDIKYRNRLKDWGLGNLGTMIYSFNGTYTATYKAELGTGTGSYDCVGLYGATCGTPDPHWRHKMRVTWKSPWDTTLSLDWRYMGRVKLDSNTSDPNLTNNKFDYADAVIGAKQYLDLSGTYTLPTAARNITLRAGVTNIAGQNPPTLSSNAPFSVANPPFGNGNTFPDVYDATGRVMFIGITADL